MSEGSGGEGSGPTPVFWPGEFHGLCSPRSRKESDTTERLSLYGILTHSPQEKHFDEYDKMLSFQEEGKLSKDTIRK